MRTESRAAGAAAAAAVGADPWKRAPDLPNEEWIARPSQIDRLAYTNKSL
jgi:hypothetical protein